MMQFSNFQDHHQPPSQTFVNPSMLNADNTSNMNGAFGQIPLRQVEQSPYVSKPGTGMDLQFLQRPQMPGIPQLQPNQMKGM